MPAKKRRAKQRQAPGLAARNREQDTVRLINEALSHCNLQHHQQPQHLQQQQQQQQDDVAQLRKVSAVRGLVNQELRARLWPRLLAAGGDDGGGGGGAAPGASSAAAQEQQLQQTPPPGGGTGGAALRRSSSGGAGAGAGGAAAALTRRSSGSAAGAAAAANGLHHPQQQQQQSARPASPGDQQPQQQPQQLVAEDDPQYLAWAAAGHKDSAVVRADVERSLHGFASFLSDAERAARRAQLERLLNALVGRFGGGVHYYQGLHDVAAVLLLVANDERAAFGMLCRLATGHLRDATRATLDPVIELLSGLMGPIVDACDAELGAFVAQQGLPPFYALSWFLTWFSHDLRDFGDVCRLFDLFLSTHPLMPLYVGAVAMRSQRAALLQAEEMPQLHSMLANLRATRLLAADQLAVQAIELFKRAPPPQLLLAARRVGGGGGGPLLQHCVAPRVTLRGGAWQYPEPRGGGGGGDGGVWSQARLQALVTQLARLPLPGATPAQRRKVLVAGVTGVLGSVYVLAMAVLFARGGGGAGGALLYRL